MMVVEMVTFAVHCMSRDTRVSLWPWITNATPEAPDSPYRRYRNS